MGSRQPLAFPDEFCYNTYIMSCLFCRMVSGEIKTEVVFESDTIFCFRDINPQAPVHILLIPKKHIAGLNDISKEDIPVLGEIQTVAKLLASKEAIDGTGYRLVTNCGADAGQAVAHLHYHLLGGR